MLFQCILKQIYFKLDSERVNFKAQQGFKKIQKYSKKNIFG